MVTNGNDYHVKPFKCNNYVEDLANIIIDNTAFNVTLSLHNIPTDHPLFTFIHAKKKTRNL
jgi:hypothetical protein